MSFADGLKTIVVATDPDGRPRAALEYARKLATPYGARLVLAYGLDPLEYAAVEGVPNRVLRKLADAARASLDEMAVAGHGVAVFREHSFAIGPAVRAGSLSRAGRNALYFS